MTNGSHAASFLFILFVPFFHETVKDIIQSLDYAFIHRNFFIKKLHTPFPHEISAVHQAIKCKRFVLCRIWMDFIQQVVNISCWWITTRLSSN